MPNSLVIVESPAKARTIGKFLGREYTVKASVGHIKDLPKSKLGVDVENGFQPSYTVIPAKAKVVRELRQAAKSSDAVYLAADPDREGEAICQHLAEELGTGRASRKVYRVLFHEITKKAVQEAFHRPGQINPHKVAAQQARRVLDRLVGYKVSPLLWDKVRRGLSAGRVQTVALRLIVERESEIRTFQTEEYWNLHARLAGHAPPEFTAKAHSVDGEKWKVSSADVIRGIVDEVRPQRFVVKRVHRREKRRYPVPPFITSKLQQDAARKLGFSVKKTMTLAQRLYEGVELGTRGSAGLITYMRTDSTRVSEDALGRVREFVQRQYGDAYLPHHAIYYKSKKTAQDAHEAIRPTDVELTPEKAQPFLDRDLHRLYALIWNRFVASQMTPAVFDQTDVTVEAGRVAFKATGSIMKFEGFLALYQEAKSEDPAPESENGGGPVVLPDLTEGEELRLLELRPSQHFTQPPPRYTEASLVKALESRGIGRPSTYASILSTIQNREYVVKQDQRFHPTETGEVVVELLVENFRELFDYDYTARLEDHLDRIESGRETWTDTMQSFYAQFSKALKVAEKEMRDLKAEEIETDEVCDKCGSRMVIKWGKFGRFLACSAYPECKSTREIAKVCSLDSKSAPEEIPDCEKCGSPMVLKRGRFGEFLACTAYPQCHNTRKITAGAAEAPARPDVPLEEPCPVCGKNLAVKSGRFGEFVACSDYPKCRFVRLKGTGVACPKRCGGELVEKKSRRGKVFYGCSSYPQCDFATWQRPLPLACPKCGAPYTLQKTTKRTGPIRYCDADGCGFKEPLPEAAAD